MTYDPTTEATEVSEETGDLPDGPFKEWPGAGPVPEPEEEGFRDKVLDAREARREKEREAFEQRSKEAADFYAGRTDPNEDDDDSDDEPVEPYDPNAPTPTEPTPSEPTYGTTGTTTTTTPSTTYGSGTTTSS